MNDLELFEYLAQGHARWGRPKRQEEIEINIPYFEIYRSGSGRYDIKGYNYEGHDNADRMALWEYYMRTKVLPMLQSSPAIIRGFYNIELHDSYTYLNNEKNYKGCLTFSKFKEDAGPVVIPDPYAMAAWGGALNGINDTTPYTSKSPKMCFYGTTTGNRNPALNERIQACIWSLKRPDLYEFKITKIAQMSPEAVKLAVEAAGTQIEKIVSQPISQQDQMRLYKYHLVMDGNTCRFDIWNWFTNTLSLKYKSREMLWYYPMLLDGQHYLEVTKDNMENKIRSVDDRNATFIIENGKRIMNRIANPITHVYYLKHLFESMGENGK